MKNVLERANEIVKERGEAYGHPYTGFDRVAKMWSGLLGQDISVDQVAQCMICVKLARLAETPDHQDSIDDIAGYAWVLDEIVKIMRANHPE